MIALLLLGILVGSILVAVIANKFPLTIGDDEY
jgi:hypothetical protein